MTNLRCAFNTLINYLSFIYRKCLNTISREYIVNLMLNNSSFDKHKVYDDYEKSREIDLNTDKRIYKICCNMYCLIGGDYCCYCNKSKSNKNKICNTCNNCKSKGQICCNKTNWKILNELRNRRL